MAWLHLVSWFFGALFLTNAVPHFVSGTMGMPFQTPFATPSGKGLSSATVNVLWGVFNLVAGYLLTWQVGNFDLKMPTDALVFGLGIALMGLVHARLFGPLHGGDRPVPA